jgi:hypothetical protein
VIHNASPAGAAESENGRRVRQAAVAEPQPDADHADPARPDHLSKEVLDPKRIRWRTEQTLPDAAPAGSTRAPSAPNSPAAHGHPADLPVATKSTSRCQRPKSVKFTSTAPCRPSIPRTPLATAAGRGTSPVTTPADQRRFGEGLSDSGSSRVRSGRGRSHARRSRCRRQVRATDSRVDPSAAAHTIKLHPDGAYLNLYHWLFGDSHDWRGKPGTHCRSWAGPWL